ncbi:MAG: FAD-dependent oxidoreductase [Candidatus Binatia bacterium]
MNSGAPGSYDRPLRVAVIGAGPAGFYTVEALLKHPEVHVEVDLFERLPAPYGLLRYGVAPDHPKIKSVSAVYDRLCENPHVRFLGNVSVGMGDLTVEELGAHYDQVVVATGCETDRRLGIDGEDLPGSHCATSFVAWYNGHPDFTTLAVNLDVERAVIVGIGDVAMDLARMLLRDPADLATTDIADYALEALRRSRIREVVILARRGPAEGAFAAKELEDIAELPGLDVSVDAGLVRDATAAADPHHGTERHKLEVLTRIAAAQGRDATRTLALRFLTSPVEIVGDGGRVCAVRIEHNELVRRGEDVVARGTGRTESVPAGLVLRSVGYLGVPIPGLPFDPSRGTVPNVDGRVLDDGSIRPRVYVAGWIKRGATGVVGTNKADAASTVARMLEDLPQLDSRDADAVSRGAIDNALRARGIRVVTWEGWKRIDRREREEGAAAGKVRRKLTSISDLLEAAGV